jgi:hypothetical protein
MCTLDIKNKGMSLVDLLEKFGFHNAIDDNAFKIRTNQVFIEIDGNEVSSLYEKNKHR